MALRTIYLKSSAPKGLVVRCSSNILIRSKILSFRDFREILDIECSKDCLIVSKSSKSDLILDSSSSSSSGEPSGSLFFSSSMVVVPCATLSAGLVITQEWPWFTNREASQWFTIIHMNYLIVKMCSKPTSITPGLASVALQNTEYRWTLLQTVGHYPWRRRRITRRPYEVSQPIPRTRIGRQQPANSLWEV